jgi:hypothetical protein
MTKEQSEARREEFEERAAIKEYDGNMKREDAELWARVEIIKGTVQKQRLTGLRRPENV